MKSKFKRTLAFTASLTMCSMTLLNFPDGTFSIPLTASAAEGDVEISEENFPDETFRTYVDEKFDTTDDDILTADEIAAATQIDFWSAGITTVADLTGVEYFTALTYLDCCDNQLTSLDASKNTALTKLDCSYNQLTSLDVSNNTALDYLYCNNNQLTSLDASKNTALDYLYCNNNQLTSLDVSKNTALTYLDCGGNQLTSLDVSKNTALNYLICNRNQLRSLDLTKNTALFYLYCINNPLLAVNAATGITSYYNASSLETFTVHTPIIRLADYGIDSTKMSDLSGCALSEDGAYLLLTGDGTASYIYDVDGENGEHTLSTSIEFPAGIEINEENFPDETFRTYIDENFDTTDDNILTADEIAAATKIDLWSEDITTVADLTGVEYFTALEYLDCDSNELKSLDVSKNALLDRMFCSNNQLTSLDVSNNTALNELYCSGNQLTSLDVSQNTALEYLSCSTNQLESLDVSNNTALKSLSCSTNQLESLDVSNNTALIVLECHYNELTILDVSQNTALKTLSCYTNQLTSLDVSNNTALEYLYCYENQLTSLDVSQNTALTTLDCSGNQLTSLDVSQNTALTFLGCDGNQLTSLDVSKNTALETLYCYSNQLTSLDVSKNTALETLYCYSNQLTSLDVSQNTALTLLGCDDNQLTSLDVSKNTALETLYCYSNQLTSLDVSQNTALVRLYCYDNQLTSLDVSYNTALETLNCYNNNYDIDLIGGTFDLTTLPEEFDITKASDWTNAEIDGNTLTVSNPTMDVTYTYDLGNGSTESFTLTPVSCTLTEDMVAEIDDQVYSGKSLEPVEIICGGYTLVKDTDYTVSYEENMNVGTATAAITGMGLFAGEVTVTFEILPKPIDNVSIDVTAPAAGKTPQDTIVEGDGYTGVISWEPAENPFDYNTIYTAVITLTPDSNHVFSENTTAEGFDAVLSEDGTVTLTKEFEVTAKSKITSLTPPEVVTLTGYYTSTDDVIALLPASIAIEAEDGTNELPIEWTLAGEFDASSNAENTFAWTADIGELDANGFETSGTITVSNIGYVAINAENFPDEIFRSYVDENFDTTDDDVLDSYEIAVVMSIDVSDKGISDLTGVEYFTALTNLYCYSNQLTILDVSKNTELEWLDCDSNQLTSLDVSKNTALEILYCSDNQLTSLEVSQNIALTDLRCQDNAITDLDVSKNTALKTLSCDSNQLTSLDVSKNTALTDLSCYNNNLKSLDVSKNAALEILYCNNNQLTSLDVSKNTALTGLYCYSNQLTSLNVSKNAALEILYCYSNKLISLDVSGCPALEILSCDSNSYAIDLIGGTFDLSKMPEGFDVTKASKWNNAAVEGDTLTVSNPASDVTYVYDLGNGSTEVFTLTPVSCTLTEDMIQPIADRNYGGGYALEPELEILCGDYSLVADTDYTVVYENNVDVGTASVTITGIGMFNGEVTTTFDILTKDISGAVIELGDTLSYNGEEQTQTFAVYLDGLLLPAQYYTVSGNIGTNAGTYTLTIEGNGNTVGTVTAEWSIEKAIPEVTPIISEGEYFAGDALPEISYESEISGIIEWLTELVNGLIEGENVLEWQFTPEDEDNYEIVTGTAVVEAQATTTTTTTTTTDDGSETTTSTTTTTTDEDGSETTTSTTTATTDDNGSETTTSTTTTTTDDDGSETTTSTTTTTTDDNGSETTTSTTTTTTDDNGSETTTSTTTTTTDEDGSETTTSTTTTTTTDDNGSETTTSTTTTTTTDDNGSETTTSTTTTTPPTTTTVAKGDADNDGDVDMDDANKVLDYVNGAIDQFGSTVEEHEAIADAVDIDGDGAVTKTDAALILGYTAEDTTWEELTSAIVPAADIDMTELNAKLAEAEAITNNNTYTEESYAALQATIEAVKATKNAENLPSGYAEQMTNLLNAAIEGLEENLPQTGYSVVYNYIMLAAAAMVLFGIFAMAKSRKRDEE